LNNTSIRSALSSYLYEEAKSANLVQTPTYTTPVKCNIRLNQKPYQAIIDSGASVSMIAHSVVKELGLKIEQASTSLIISATGTSARPLGIIKDLLVEIEGALIPINVEVVPATSYTLLLGNDWSKKVEASYNWKNGCYSFKWKNKKFSIPTSYENNHPLPTQPTVTDLEELDLYEQEYLTPQEAYAFTIVDPEPSPNEDSSDDWTVYRPKQRTRNSRSKRKVCGNCGSPNHFFVDCPTNLCNRCHQTGHIAINCPKNAPQRTTCRTCGQEDHLYKECPHNTCYGCNERGHIEIECPLTSLKRQNQTLQCGCNRDDIEARRMQHYSNRRTHHCCNCKVPVKPEDLKLVDNYLYCRGCTADFHYDLDREDPRSIHYYNQGDEIGLLVTCKLCLKSDPKSRMYRLESLQEELWFCDLEHLYAYKACSDILYNPNCNLWTRIQHYTTSTSNAGHQYDMNQTRIFRLAKIYLEESDQTITEALEPLATDRSNHWSDDDISLILRAEQQYDLNDHEEYQLQETLRESFDMTHPDFNKQIALANLRRTFQVPVDLCKECIHVKHQDELDKHNGYCIDCAPPPLPIYEPDIIENNEAIGNEQIETVEIGNQETLVHETKLVENIEPEIAITIESTIPAPSITGLQYQLQQQLHQQSLLIEQLQHKVNNLENFNQQLVRLLQANGQQTQTQLNNLTEFLEPRNF
jgi:hypothetical protein